MSKLINSTTLLKILKQFKEHLTPQNKSTLDTITSEVVSYWTDKTDVIETNGTGEKYLSDDGTYKEIDGVGGSIELPEEIDDVISKSHEHGNKTVLDKLSEDNGLLAFDGQVIEGSTVNITKEISNPLTTTDISDETPIGTVIEYIDNVPPKHYLLCDGSVYNIADYLSLANRFLATYGRYNCFGGDGITTFAVPNQLAYNALKLEMRSNTLPSPYVVTADGYSSGYQPYLAFNGTNSSNSDCWVVSMGNTSHWIGIDLGDVKKIKGFTIRNRYEASSITGAPKDFSLQASNDGVNFTIIKSFTEVTWETSNLEKTFMLDASVVYRHYRINITANNGYTNLIIGEIGFLEYVLRNPVIKYEPTYYAVNQYGGFDTEALFDGSLTSASDSYEILAPLTNYKFAVITTQYLTNKEYVDIIPALTSDKDGSGYISSASSVYDSTLYPAFLAFNKKNAAEGDGWLAGRTANTGWLQIQLPQPEAVSKFSLGRTVGGSAVATPKDFQFLGSNDGETFTTLKEVTNAINWLGGEVREYIMNNNEKYKYYRINISSNNGGQYVAIGEVALFKSLGAEETINEYHLISPEEETSTFSVYPKFKDKTAFFTLKATGNNITVFDMDAKEINGLKISKIIGIKGSIPSLVQGGTF